MFCKFLAVAALAVTGPMAASAEPHAGTEASAMFLADNHGAMSHGAMAGDAMAGDGAYQVGDLVVEAPWSRASAGGAGAGGAFMMIRNGGHHGDRLIRAESDVAARVQVHMTVMQDGVMRMRHAEDGTAQRDRRLLGQHAAAPPTCGAGCSPISAPRAVDASGESCQE